MANKYVFGLRRFWREGAIDEPPSPLIHGHVPGVRASLRIVLAACIFLILPMALYMETEQLREGVGPYWLAHNSDPDYAYLFNSLNIVNLRTPEHLDHPGTTLQLLGGAVLVALNPGKSSSEITAAVMADPERYLGAINQVLRVMNVIILFVTGVICFVATRSLVAALLVQVPFVVSSQVVVELTRVKPESLLLLATTLIAGLIVLAASGRLSLSNKAVISGLASLSGFGLATKLSFLPVTLIPLILLDTYRARQHYVGSTVLFAICFTLPIIGRYEKFVSWSVNLAVRSGQHGSGEMTIIDVPMFWKNLYDVLQWEPNLSLLITIGAGVFLVAFGVRSRKRDGQRAVLFRAAGAVLIALIAQVLLVAKHPGSNSYLIPAIGLSGLIASLMYLLVKSLIQSWARMELCVASLCAILVVLSGVDQWKRLDNIRQYLHSRWEEAAALDKIRVTQFADCHQVFYYRSSSLAYAEHFGAAYSGPHFYDGDIVALHGPDTYFFNIWTQRIDSVGATSVSLDDLSRSGACVMFQGSWFAGDYLQYKPGFSFDDDCGGTYETIYISGRKCRRGPVARS